MPSKQYPWHKYVQLFLTHHPVPSPALMLTSARQILVTSTRIYQRHSCRTGKHRTHQSLSQILIGWKLQCLRLSLTSINWEGYFPWFLALLTWLGAGAVKTTAQTVKRKSQNTVYEIKLWEWSVPILWSCLPLPNSKPPSFLSLEQGPRQNVTCCESP